MLEYRDLVKGPDRIVWVKGFSNELGRLAQGVGGRVKGTDTIKFITKKEVPMNYKVTYGKIVADFKPHKEEKHRIRLTVGDDKID